MVHNMEEPVRENCVDTVDQTEGKKAVILLCWAEMQVKRPLWIGHAALQSLHKNFWMGEWEKDKKKGGGVTSVFFLLPQKNWSYSSKIHRDLTTTMKLWWDVV